MPRAIQIFVALFVFAATHFAHAADMRLARDYPWGSLRVTAGESKDITVDDAALLAFSGNVLAELRFADGRRCFIACGHLVFDPVTGHFTATELPFLLGINGEIRRQIEGLDENSTIRLNGKGLTFTGQLKSYLGGVPANVLLRRQQLADLEKAADAKAAER